MRLGERQAAASVPKGLRVAGLFAGIGGIELGLEVAGHRSELLCEIDPGAQAILRAHFPEIPVVGDVKQVMSLPSVDLIAAGFPCQDLSQAGRTKGINGSQSSLVGEVFRLLSTGSVKWLLLENVPFMLQLERGSAMEYLTSSLMDMGYTWAYRIVNSMSFGLPQRRRRVVLLASKDEDPRPVLFNEDAGPPKPRPHDGRPCGFYWTEGLRGLGWAVDSVPTIKGGSTIGIPSPPAIWMAHKDGEIVTPDIRDAERLQGFDADWTLPALESGKRRKGTRWKYVGNAVNVGLSKWIGERLASHGSFNDGTESTPLPPGSSWPTAAWGHGGHVFKADLSEWPVRRRFRPLSTFLKHEPAPLSLRAATGFLSRARKAKLRFVDGFLEAVEAHCNRLAS